jgi:pimeloyl-ACP methyl ester carboxylesterase
MRVIDGRLGSAVQTPVGFMGAAHGMGVSLRRHARRGPAAFVGAARDMGVAWQGLSIRSQPARPAAAGAQGRAAGSEHLPVLLVHGYGGSPADWARVAEGLSEAGFGMVRAFGYDAFEDDIPTIAGQLARAARRLLAEAGTAELHLVGHSLGGVIVRHAVTFAGLDPVAAGAVTIAAPHGGCALAAMGVGPAVAQIRYGSDVLRSLEAAARPGRARWVAFYAEGDVIVPTGRARLRPAPLAARNVRVPGEGHLSILASPRLTAGLVAHLCAAEAENAAAATSRVVSDRALADDFAAAA